MAVYQKEQLNRIRFPLGGIGSGSVSLCGNGMLADWEIYNAPAKGSVNGYTHFAVKAAQNGKTVDARVLRGDQQDELEGHFSERPGHIGFGYGPDAQTMAGFPHFRDLTFYGTFPTAKIDFAEPAFPGKVSLEAWSPFIPLKADESSLPVACFTLSVLNTSAEALDYTFAMTVANPAKQFCDNRPISGGVVLGRTDLEETDVNWGELCAVTPEQNAKVQRYWYRGSWFDSLGIYWREFCSDKPMPQRDYQPDERRGLECATMTVTVHAEAGETAKADFVLAWYYPRRKNDWNPREGEQPWKNWYATRWKSAEDAANFALNNRKALYAETIAFRDALHTSDLPAEAIDAASSNLAVLRSPTSLRLEDGTFYGWEGVSTSTGSCEGTCTHVWSYAYALCYLFPSLERSIREADYKYNLEPSGYMTFRLPLPLGRQNPHFHACVDGQMLGIVKVLREWKLSGDNEWLHKIWPSVKCSLSFAWSRENPDEWDRDCDGILEGRQHHTLDMELFGPSSWLEGIYLAALKAGSIMARQEQDTEFADLCDKLFANGSKFMEESLFNGSWYIQQVNLLDKAALEHFGCTETYWNDEAGEMKYQIAGGSIIDQMLGQYHANLCGLGKVYDPSHLKTAIAAMFRNNFKPTMREFYNPCRLFALNDEGGTVICDYPEGTPKPVVPIPYCEECMTGFEYAFAVLAIQEGFVAEGLQAVRAIRDRYDGKKRNPYNEIECGSNYARTMASFALIPALTGFSADAVTGKLTVKPQMGSRSGFFCGTGWGTLEYNENGFTMTVLGGFVRVGELDTEKPVKTAEADGKALEGLTEIRKTLKVAF